MKIISNFKDYYDGCSINADEDIFVRKQKEEIEIDIPYKRTGWSDSNPFFISNRVYGNSCCTYDIFYVGFCGNVYLGVEFTEIFKSDHLDNKTITHFKYPVDIKEDSKWLDDHDERESLFQRESYEDLLFKAAPRLKYIFEKYKTPIFTVKSSENNLLLDITPKLVDIDWPRMFDTYQCYQEIDMYLTNMRKPELIVLIPTGDDIVLANSKGFDKFSFRTIESNSKRINRKRVCN